MVDPSAATDSAPAETGEPAAQAEAPPTVEESESPSAARTVAERTWWVPWLLGIAAAVVAVLLLTGAFDGEPTPEERIQDRQAELVTSTHVVVYEVNGTGKSPEIRYVVDGSAGTEKVEGVDLPWRKEVEITVGPGVGIAQLLAANGDGDSITCSVSVDGQVVNQGVARGPNSNVACSAVVRPTADE